MDPLMHYVRYQGKAILASKGTLLLKKKWKSYLVNFSQYFFSFWTQPQRICLNRLTNSCFDFMGYLSSVPINTLLVRNQMLENSFRISIRMKKFDTIVPATPLIGALSKAQFCTCLAEVRNFLFLVDTPHFPSCARLCVPGSILHRFGQKCRKKEESRWEIYAGLHFPRNDLGHM